MNAIVKQPQQTYPQMYNTFKSNEKYCTGYYKLRIYNNRNHKTKS